MSGNYRFRQFESTDFYRAFRVDESVDAANISAHCADGVLTVHLPKAETLKPRITHREKTATFALTCFSVLR
jgi:HSP20 family molecular chaperone IbpA